MNERKPIPISVFWSKWEADQLRLKLAARREYGFWLPDAFVWSHFITLTFALERTLEAVRHSFFQWIRHLERRLHRPIGWFYVIEVGAAGRLHLHVLTAGTERLTVSELTATWKFGRADASVYDPAKPGSFYITKDFGLRRVEYDIASSRKLVPKVA